MNPGSTYPWRRYWIRRGGTAFLSDGGYLADPERRRATNPDAAPWDVIASTLCLVLLGERGMGKSRAIELAGLAQDGPSRIFLNLRGFSDQGLLHQRLFGSAQFGEWLNSDARLEIVLDGLDECLIHIKTVASWLVDELKKYPVSRLALRIACRTAEWPDLLDQELPRIWTPEQVGVYELAPLRRIDVAQAASLEGLEADAFETAVHTSGVVGLAVNPITLGFLLKEFRPGGGLPQDPVELYRRGCLRLCSELNSSRRVSSVSAPPAPARLLSVAERIAAVMMFSRKRAVYAGSDPDEAGPDELTIPLLTKHVDVVESRQFEVTEQIVEETLRTGLFSGRESQRLGFAHLTYAEFLAARFCLTRGLAAGQIDDLIFGGEIDGRPQVVPQLAESAAWLAAMSSEFLQRIAANDPQVLLRSSVMATDASTRARVTSSLLELLDQGKLIDHDDGIENRYDVLMHPGLGKQLEPYIRNNSKNVVVRRVSVAIAEACRVTSLAPLLAEVALDTAENSHIRDRAAHAVAELGGTEMRARLRPLLVSSEAEDPNDQLKGNALRALWPDHLRSDELFANLTPTRRRSFFGAYSAFVAFELPATLKSADLTAALAWARDQLELSEPWYDGARLVSSILKLAWGRFDDPIIASAFTDVLERRIERHRPIFPHGSGEDETHFFHETTRRRELVRLLVQRLVHGPQSRWYALLDAGLINTDDFGWLIQSLHTSASPAEKETWTELISAAFTLGRPDHLDELLDGVRTEPVLDDRFRDLLSPVALGSGRAIEMRERYLANQRRDRPTATPKPIRPEIPEIVSRWLKKLDAGDGDAWWRLNLDLTLKRDSDAYPPGVEFNSDLTSLPGWAELSEQLRHRCIDGAEMYLQIGEPKVTEWLGTDTVYRPASAGYRALRLLLELRPEALDRLSDDQWNKWAAVILTFPEASESGGNPARKELLRRAYERAPGATEVALSAIIERERSTHGHLLILDRLDQLGSERLSDWLLARAESDPTLPARSVGDIFRYVLPEGGDQAVRAGCDIIAQRTRGDAQRARAVAVAIELLNARPAESWDAVWREIRSDEAFGKEIITGLATHYQQLHAARIALQLPERAVGDLYVWVYRRFPPDEDPDVDGAHAVGTRESVGTFRNGLISRLQERGTKEAADAIRRIATEFPESWWLPYQAIATDRKRLRLDWRGVPPDAVLSMATNRHVRIIESEAQLLQVVLESTERLQTRLHGETPAVVDLWNDDVPKDEMALSDYIKRHLEADLNSLGVLACREAEVRRGQETDIYVAAIARDPLPGAGRKVTVVVEVKGCWNPDLKTAMRDQLKERYLKDRGGYGLYLVGWFLCEKWRDEARRRRTPKLTLESAREFFQKQSSSLTDGGVTLAAFVLDASLR